MNALRTLKIEFRRINRRRINGMRNFILKAIILLFDSTKNSCRFEKDAPILVLRSDGKIGDSIMATGFFRELKIHSPESKIIVIGNSQVFSIYKSLPYIDEIFFYKKGLLSTIRIFLRLRNQRFKYFFNTTDEIKPHAAFLQGQVKANKKIIFRNSLLKSSTEVIDFLPGQAHFSYLYENALKTIFTDKNFDISYELNLKDESLNKVEALIKKQVSQGKRLISFNAFAGTERRSFSFDTSLSILSYLLSDPNNIVISLASPQDLKTVHTWKKKASCKILDEHLERWLILDELNCLEESLSVIKLSDFLITPDTSLVHAACAFNKKVVAVYRQRQGYKHSNVWGPRMADESNYRVVQAYSDSPTFWDVNLLKFEDIKPEIDYMLSTI